MVCQKYPFRTNTYICLERRKYGSSKLINGSAEKVLLGGNVRRMNKQGASIPDARADTSNGKRL